MPKTDLPLNLADYSTVAERIALFYSANPTGRITTRLVSRENGETIFKASVFRAASDKYPAATGWAAEREGDGDVNTVACLENTETSAVGRALANLGFTASSKRPSREEMEKVARSRHSNVSSQRRSNWSFDSQQNHASALHDLVDLVAQAESAGFSKVRGNIIRGHVRSDVQLRPPQIARLENQVRSWLLRHEL
jgi:hypothetical protein